ncbi:carbamate kinase [Sulfodiicoccus acidiphilus]|uniref:Carbamate kinase n=1 Tax=Sulfodiicoccus acidiphilus TaxID=1670455 RepID=A0A348B6D7_9CREN|nr:carbamate kinase [Sulfodiicoccus acidiphilus]GGT97992.1 carbamate kinase [Sulfodiicoccus acidiphilus]
MEQEAVAAAASDVADLLELGRVVVTHGNGPQVGEVISSAKFMTLDQAVGCTQGWMGSALAEALRLEMSRRKLPDRTVVIVTRVLVDTSKAWLKPIGPRLSKEEVEEFTAKGVTLVRDPRGGVRRAVPSPEPLAVVEAEAIRSLVKEGFLVVCCGGGGVPTTEEGSVEAVVDKDLASQVLANSLQADNLIILTDADYVYVDFGTPNQRPLRRMSLQEAEVLLSQGQFGEGSMAPKVEAAVRFLRGGGKRAFIGRLGKGREIVKGESGTEVVK